MRSDNDRTFQIMRCLISNGSINQHCVNAAFMLKASKVIEKGCKHVGIVGYIIDLVIVFFHAHMSRPARKPTLRTLLRLIRAETSRLKGIEV